ncbi:MAG TPA: POTRA domain-containing protein, partial [Gammaproteobacteria bacterium]|nr:POTRA domain-containing protein [Gammaproteobacteria bacterium]
MRRHDDAAACVLGVLIVLGASAAAQDVARPQDVVASGAEEDLTRLDAVEVSTIRIDGSSVFTPAELAAAAAPYEHRAISFEQLDELRHALSQGYAARGYVNSGVVIPDQ